ncbi:MAG TPA: sigma factor-like helix-turn-helix DNA-binding protein [Candidatus Polarisedimenticolia bacterium]|nr:sigma factor-like helix-turn-helix DNA-binding protein [Candidatus Polarisedimenticolia bacterium]
MNALADPFALNPEDVLLRKEQRRIVQGAVSELTMLEQVVISHRFGLETEEPLTLGRIGEICGLTRQRILQIEARAKERLRKGVQKRGWPWRDARTPKRPKLVRRGRDAAGEKRTREVSSSQTRPVLAYVPRACRSTEQ